MMTTKGEIHSIQTRLNHLSHLSRGTMMNEALSQTTLATSES